jgi:D-alanyl-D-alanine carboxypeptidase
LVRITSSAVEMIGTTADLKQSTWVSIEDLLFGTMLPSGNDAAYTLAEYLGYLMSQKSKKAHSEIKKLDLTR